MDKNPKPLNGDAATQDAQGSDSTLEQLRRINEQLDSEFAHMLQEEISELEIISRFTESVETKLRRHYAAIFPKKCNNCGSIYETREDYLTATSRLAKKTTIFDEIGLQEYRNCPCGSTLVVWTKDRRDNTEYGKVRRHLFERCLAKLSQVSSKSEAEIREQLRQIFSSISS